MTARSKGYPYHERNPAGAKLIRRFYKNVVGGNSWKATWQKAKEWRARYMERS